MTLKVFFHTKKLFFLSIRILYITCHLSYPLLHKPIFNLAMSFSFLELIEDIYWELHFRESTGLPWYSV